MILIACFPVAILIEQVSPVDFHLIADPSGESKEIWTLFLSVATSHDPTIVILYSFPSSNCILTIEP